LDPALVALLKRNLTSSESLKSKVSQLSQTHEDPVDATKITKVSPPSFPKLDGNINSLAIFLARVNTFKKHKYFDNVNDWTKASYTVEDEARHIRTEMFDNLGKSELSTFINDAY
jgi:hypothetical protein